MPATAQTVMERQQKFHYVSQFRQPEYFLPRCFATLFPYGRGCPSDKSTRTTNVKKHTAHMLCLGGGPNPRRFQQSSKYIFTMYVMEMKRKTGGVAYAAQRKQLSSLPIEDDKLPTVGDINRLLLYLNNTNDLIDTRHNSNDNEDERMTNNAQKNTLPNNNETEIQKLIQRLVPYSQSLQGTAPHIAFERTKLMAMIPSPIMKKIGSCRWFLTMAPSDKYENRTIEVIQDAIVDDSTTAWEQRALQVRSIKSFRRLLYHSRIN
jgi:hypothetical protein